MLGELQKRDSVNQYNFFSKYCIKKKDTESNIVSNEDKIIYIQGSVNSLRPNGWQHRRKLKEALLILHPTIFEAVGDPFTKTYYWCEECLPSPKPALNTKQKAPCAFFENNKDVSHLQVVIPTTERIKISPILQRGEDNAENYMCVCVFYKTI